MAESMLFFNNKPDEIIGTNNDSIKWLNSCLIRVSRIPEETIFLGIKVESLRYQRFIDKFVKNFIDKLFNKLIELNK
jgi:hypothetical protein